MKFWYRPSPLSILLLPLAWLFSVVVAIRRTAYQAGVLRSTKIPVPVIVVGNITVGGTGKTPLVLWLVETLRAQGLRPGIISRGYGGSKSGQNAGLPCEVKPDAEPAFYGDEPVLLAQRAAGSNVPVWIHKKRAAAARALLAAHPEVNVILSDDGLQHHALQRDIEIAVIDGARGFGNGFLLPAGPLREPKRRLESVNAIVINGECTGKFKTPASVPSFTMNLLGASFYNLREPALQATPKNFHEQAIHAYAAIGNPQRFFEHLRTFGLTFTEHALPDHHAYTAQDFAGVPANAVVLMTEKDAVKCRHLANQNFWALRVNAEFKTSQNAGFAEYITQLLKHHG